jgi:hypothetical protein
MIVLPAFPAGGERAVLVSGNRESLGLPGFPENRIPALYGRYEGDGVPVAAVWATGEPLVFRREVWTARKAGRFSARETMAGTVETGQTRVWAVERRIPFRESAGGPAAWHFLFEFPPGFPEDRATAFLDAFIDRAEFFFSSARLASDLSLPAVLELSAAR